MAMSSARAASAAEAAATRIDNKYIEISRVHLFYPIALEIMGPINQVGQDSISELGRRISSSTDDPRETSFLFQRLSVAVQRFNAVSFSLHTRSASHNLKPIPKHTEAHNRV